MGCKFKNRCPSYSGWCEGIDKPDEGCFSYILSDYENEKKKTEDLEWIYHIPEKNYGIVDFDAVEKALGFRLFGWQKDYIITGCAYASRRTGKTTAEILHQLLSVDEEPIDFSRPAPSTRIAINRQYYRDIWEKLRDAGIPMRLVFWSRGDKKKYDVERYDKGYQDGKKEAIDNIWTNMRDRTERIRQSNPPEFLEKCMNIRVPDCNDCGCLNYTEKEQRDYGINSYKKDHRCRCYERPVYHRANSTKHDTYIHPCEECHKDNFVNYYDCESIDKKDGGMI